MRHHVGDKILYQAPRVLHVNLPSTLIPLPEKMLFGIASDGPNCLGSLEAVDLPESALPRVLVEFAPRAAPRATPDARALAAVHVALRAIVRLVLGQKASEDLFGETSPEPLRFLQSC